MIDKQEIVITLASIVEEYVAVEPTMEIWMVILVMIGMLLMVGIPFVIWYFWKSREVNRDDELENESKGK